MAELTPKTDLTLAKAKQYMSDNFAKYTFKKTSHLYFGLLIYDVQAIEDVPNANSLRKRQFRLYAESDVDMAKAWWEATQGPMSAPAATPEPSFTSRVEIFIKTKIDDHTIKFGFVAQLSEQAKKAICNVIMPDKTDKSVLITENPDGGFLFEVL